MMRPMMAALLLLLALRLRLPDPQSQPTSAPIPRLATAVASGSSALGGSNTGPFSPLEGTTEGRLAAAVGSASLASSTLAGVGSGPASLEGKLDEAEAAACSLSYRSASSNILFTCWMLPRCSSVIQDVPIFPALDLHKRHIPSSVLQRERGIWVHQKLGGSPS